MAAPAEFQVPKGTFGVARVTFGDYRSRSPFRTFAPAVRPAQPEVEIRRCRLKTTPREESMTIGLERLRRVLNRQIMRPPAVATYETASSASVKSWLWKAYLAIGLALTAGYFALPTRDLQNLTYQVPEMLGVLAMFAGILIHRPKDPRPWILITVGLTLSMAGDWIWVLLSMGYGIEPFPSVADVFYLAGDAFVIIGLLAMVHKRLP